MVQAEQQELEMKIEIWNAPEETEDVLRLRLRSFNDTVYLETVGEDGRARWNILAIKPQGIKLCAGSGAGLPTDKRGRVKIIP